MSGHTPGPWSIGPTAILQQVAIMSGRDFLAVVYGTTGENEANANLIAAAPDLLSVAVQARAAMITIFNDPATSEEAKRLIERKCEYLSAAIARAKGEK